MLFRKCILIDFGRSVPRKLLTNKIVITLGDINKDHIYYIISYTDNEIAINVSCRVFYRKGIRTECYYR